MGGKVLVPTREAVAKLVAARLAADTLGVPTVLVARTDAKLATSSPATSTTTTNFIDRRAHGRRLLPHPQWPRPSRQRGWPTRRMRTWWCGDRQARPRLRPRLCRGHPRQVPGKLLAYNCSPSFNWKKNLDDATIAKFQRELGAMGYKFQFITLAGFHSLNYAMFNLAHGYARNNMSAFVEL